MSRVLEGLKPEKVFYYFEEIAGIPHGSYHVEQISDYLVAFAKERNLEVYQDEFYNVLIKADGTHGLENAPTVILQGHMDMVCTKNPDVEFDFLTEGLKLKVEGDKITASGTTLGGDDGIAVAYALAILDDESVKHPPLEVLITTEEEVGMEGARGFDTSKLSGKYFINIDSEEEGTLLTSCAGGLTFRAKYDIDLKEPALKEASCYEISISGLRGGHSGDEIHLGRANAIIVMGQLLYVFSLTGIPYELVSVSGGQKQNAIPTESRAVLRLKDAHKESISIVLQDFVTRIGQEFVERDPDIRIDMKPVDTENVQVLNNAKAQALIDALAHVTDGVARMSEDVKGMVETSSNLGVMEGEAGQITLNFLLRSSKDSELDRIAEVISYVLNQGVKIHADMDDKEFMHIELSDRYPGWAYKEESSLRELFMDAFRAKYGREMVAEGIHAGLECGLFSEKGDYDIISFGPDIHDIHTPRETLMIESTKRTYELLLDVLSRADELK